MSLDRASSEAHVSYNLGDVDGRTYPVSAELSLPGVLPYPAEHLEVTLVVEDHLVHPGVHPRPLLPPTLQAPGHHAPHHRAPTLLGEVEHGAQEEEQGGHTWKVKGPPESP